MRMNLVFVSMLAVATLASCSKDDVTAPGNGTEVPAGQSTYATFNFKVEGDKAGSRAGHTVQVADESKVVNIRLLIFDGAGLDAKLQVNVLEAVTALTSKTIATTSGDKRIFILSNSDVATHATLGAKLDGLTVGTTLAAFYGMMTDQGYKGTEIGDEFKQSLLTGNMFMASVADATSLKTLAAGVTEEESKNATAGVTSDKNHFSFNVKRSVAKGQLSVAVAEAEVGTKDGLCEFSDISYGVRNVSYSTNYVQQFIGGHIVTSNDGALHATDATRPTDPFYTVFDGKTDVQMQNKAMFDDYYFDGFALKGTGSVVAAIGKNGATVTPAAHVYFTENSNKKQVMGNTTYFGIAARVSTIKAEKIAADFNFDQVTGKLSTTAATAPYAVGTDFWYIINIPTAAGIVFATPADARRVFVNEDKAFQAIHVVLSRAGLIKTDLASATEPNYYPDPTALKLVYNNAADTKHAHLMDVIKIHSYFGKYTEGVCYYRLNIYETFDASKTKRHLVRRNHAYSAKVTGFKTLGLPTEGDLEDNPQIPVDQATTHITATITVQGWHDMNMEDEL